MACFYEASQSRFLFLGLLSDLATKPPSRSHATLNVAIWNCRPDFVVYQPYCILIHTQQYLKAVTFELWNLTLTQPNWLSHRLSDIVERGCLNFRKSYYLSW